MANNENDFMLHGECSMFQISLKQEFGVQSFILFYLTETFVNVLQNLTINV